MSGKILVAYATRYGSTQEVAEEIARILRETGTAVDLQPMREVRTLEGVDAVVLGAALYMFHLHSDAKRFLARHKDALIQRPVASFVLGPTTPDEQEMVESRKQLDKELEQYPWFRPVALEIFVGKLDPEKVNILWKPFMRHETARDYRDWDAIRAWANSLQTALAVR